MRVWKKISLGSNRKSPGNFILINKIGKTENIYHMGNLKKISIMKIKYTISIRKKATEAFYEPCNKALGMVVELGEVRLKALGN